MFSKIIRFHILFTKHIDFIPNLCYFFIMDYENLIMEEKTLATIREVAKLANVSPSTVSRILSGDTEFNVTEETREIVFKAVNELGYVPYMKRPKKEVKKAEKKLKTITAGCIFSSMYGNEQVDLNHNRLITLAEKYLKRENISLAFTMSEHKIAEPANFQKFADNPPDVILYMVRANADLYQKIRAVVPYGVGINSYYPGMDNVTYSKERSSEEAVDYLLNLHCKHIAYIGGPGQFDGNIYTSRNFTGYKNTLERYSLYDERYVRDCRWLVEKCYEHTKELLELSPRPDAIICGSDNIAFSVYRAIYEKGLRIPDDIMVVSKAELPISEYLTPRLTTFEIPNELLIRTAVDLLVRRIHGFDESPMEIVYPAKLVIRESTRK